MITSELQKLTDELIQSRRSIRAFLPKSVDEADIRAILEVAARAPSGTNTQPWKVYVVTGEKKQQISRDIMAAHNDPTISSQHKEEYDYYPKTWVSPYIDRRRKVGWDLYGLLELKREDKVGMHKQHGRNYTFFDAPVGMFFTIDRIMERGSWLDYGMFLQNLMLAAKARGLDTCPQAAFTQYHAIISSALNIPSEQMLICGLSMGYADLSKVENTLVTARDPVDTFCQFFS